jgi:hypothetical protein
MEGEGGEVGDIGELGGLGMGTGASVGDVGGSDYGGQPGFGAAPSDYGGQPGFGAAPSDYGGQPGFGAAPSDYDNGPLGTTMVGGIGADPSSGSGSAAAIAGGLAVSGMMGAGAAPSVESPYGGDTPDFNDIDPFMEIPPDAIMGGPPAFGYASNQDAELPAGATLASGILAGPLADLVAAAFGPSSTSTAQAAGIAAGHGFSSAASAVNNGIMQAGDYLSNSPFGNTVADLLAGPNGGHDLSGYGPSDFPSTGYGGVTAAQIADSATQAAQNVANVFNGSTTNDVIASSVFGDSGAALNKGDVASAVGMNLAGGVSPAAGFGVATYAGPDMGSTAGVPAETPGITGTGQSSSAMNAGTSSVSIDSGPMSVAVGGIPSNMAVNSGDKNAIDMAADRENAPATSGGGRAATIEQAVTSGPSPPDFGLHGPTEHFGGGQTSSGQNGFGDFGSGLSSLGGNGIEALNSIFDAHEVAKSDSGNPVTQKVLGPWAAFSPFKDNPFWTFNF